MSVDRLSVIGRDLGGREPESCEDKLANATARLEAKDRIIEVASEEFGRLEAQLAGAVDDAHALASYVRFLLQDAPAPVKVAELLERYPRRQPIIHPAKGRSRSPADLTTP